MGTITQLPQIAYLCRCPAWRLIPCCPKPKRHCQYWHGVDTSVLCLTFRRSAPHESRGLYAGRQHEEPVVGVLIDEVLPVNDEGLFQQRPNRRPGKTPIPEFPVVHTIEVPFALTVDCQSLEEAAISHPKVEGHGA